jgi:hypothetical protein
VSVQPNQRPKVGRALFTDGAKRDVFEDALERQFVEDDGAPFAGQWPPPTDEPAVVDLPHRPQ